jgi:hypothetical protein
MADQPSGTRHYTCELCGGEFESEWTKEEREAEARSSFPGLRKEDEAVVCDVCYRKVMEGHTPERWRAYKKSRQ